MNSRRTSPGHASSGTCASQLLTPVCAAPPVLTMTIGIGKRTGQAASTGTHRHPWRASEVGLLERLAESGMDIKHLCG